MLNIRINDEPTRLTPRITVVGVGGAGGNAINNMIRTHMEGCDFLVCNTDSQALQQSLADRQIQLGTHVTRGLGAGARPDVGRAAAEESIDEIISYLEGSNMVFIACGMGGGTGTGAAPVIARAARDAGILTVGVATKPFHFEGTHRMRLAEEGIRELQEYVDTLIVIPNQNLFRIANEKTTFADAFKMADDVLMSGVRGVTDLMVMPGLINLDFADIRSVMAEMGKAMMGTGEAMGDRRAIEAAEAAISNPLLDDVSMKGAKGVLINITGGMDMTLFEVDEAANRIRDEVDPDANIIFGSTFDENLEGTMRVSVVATGIDVAEGVKPKTSGASEGGFHPFRKPEPVAEKVVEKVAAPVMQEKAIEEEIVEEKVAAVGGGIMTPHGHHIPPAGLPFRPATETPRVEVSEGFADVARPYQSGSNIPAMRQAQPAGNVPNTGMSGQRIGGAFIPPAPATAEQFSRETVREEGFNPFKNAVEPTGSATTTAPAATADQGGAQAEQPKKSPSLFERITNSFTGRDEEGGAVHNKIEPSLGGTKATGGKSDDDDEFDIPAFLRRQAN